MNEDVYKAMVNGTIAEELEPTPKIPTLDELSETKRSMGHNGAVLSPLQAWWRYASSGVWIPQSFTGDVTVALNAYRILSDAPRGFGYIKRSTYQFFPHEDRDAKRCWFVVFGFAEVSYGDWGSEQLSEAVACALAFAIAGKNDQQEVLATLKEYKKWKSTQ